MIALLIGLILGGVSSLLLYGAKVSSDERAAKDSRFGRLPLDGEEGFLPGAEIQLGGATADIYVNIGTDTSCRFIRKDAILAADRAQVEAERHLSAACAESDTVKLCYRKDEAPAAEDLWGVDYICPGCHEQSLHVTDENPWCCGMMMIPLN